jgi:hypothetical protein
VRKIPLKKLKFLDEAKDLLSRKVLDFQNHRVYMKANTIHAARASITILISLDNAIVHHGSDTYDLVVLGFNRLQVNILASILT